MVQSRKFLPNFVALYKFTRFNLTERMFDKLAHQAFSSEELHEQHKQGLYL